MEDYYTTKLKNVDTTSEVKNAAYAIYGIDCIPMECSFGGEYLSVSVTATSSSEEFEIQEGKGYTLSFSVWTHGNFCILMNADVIRNSTWDKVERSHDEIAAWCRSFYKDATFDERYVLDQLAAFMGESFE